MINPVRVVTAITGCGPLYGSGGAEGTAVVQGHGLWSVFVVQGHGPWSRVHGSWSRVHGSWSQVVGLCSTVYGSRFNVQGPGS